MDRFGRWFYDSHPSLPLDPDGDRLKVVRPMHTDPAHIAVVATGAFAGTMARYQISLWLPAGKDSWPVAILLVNVTGAFLLGLLLQLLLDRGKDEGGRRILRLLLGTGFLGAFTTYSTLALGTVQLVRAGHSAAAVAYALTSVMLGIGGVALGIQMATRQGKRAGR